ncbi:MAG: methylated-DNA--[protein]-cysteine S-methyltransferase [Candidatus Omnitrophica bacterium]|nr:methylated-DNA--[protein]-cysteine S-methyltransferase [Candidatus Omnitrophota bacterium]
MSVIEYAMSSPVGTIHLQATEKGLRGVNVCQETVTSENSISGPSPQKEILKSASDQLKQYFKGERQDFDIPLDLDGTDFQKRVWKELSRIPFGKTVSYADIAKKIRNPKAVRAVGNANGKNPVCIVVPCHRVIASDGGIGGYSGGLPVKRSLLKLEGVSAF